MNNCSKEIIFVGSGIKFYAHLTQEAIAAVRGCEKVFYLVNEPAMEQWVEEQNPTATSLSAIYFSHKSRTNIYDALSNEVLAAAQSYSSICVVLYGHPSILNATTQLTIEKSKNRKEQIAVNVLPGISADSTLYCDLDIDPLRTGLQSYEATDFLIHETTLNTRSQLLLWQVGVIGCQGHVKEHDNAVGISLLKEKLLKHYPENHLVNFYEASQYPHIKPVIHTVPISEIDKAEISKLMTLNIPPLSETSYEEEYYNALRSAYEVIP